MKKQRLLKLADMLVADAKKKKGIQFNLRLVGFTRKGAGESVPLDCGTQACAMGLAALSGAFKRAGLSYRVTDGFLNNIETTINGKVRCYDRAAMHVFDITARQASFLFNPGLYPDMDLTGAKAERFVAKRIRDFVAGKVQP